MRRIVAIGRITAMVAVSSALLFTSVPVRASGWFGTTERWRIRASARITRWWCRANLWLCGVRVERPASAPPRAGVITSNHLSYLDILLLGATLPCRFIAKSDIRRWPFIGLLAWSVDTLFIDQGKRSEVRRLADEIERTSAAGIAVTFFPGGGIGDGRALQPFHAGLLSVPARDEVPCLAACVHYDTTRPGLDPRTEIGWTTDEPLGTHFLRLLGRGHVVATVRWAEATIVERDRKALATRLHTATDALFEPLRSTRPDAG